MYYDAPYWKNWCGVGSVYSKFRNFWVAPRITFNFKSLEAKSGVYAGWVNDLIIVVENPFWIASTVLWYKIKNGTIWKFQKRKIYFRCLNSSCKSVTSRKLFYCDLVSNAVCIKIKYIHSHNSCQNLDYSSTYYKFSRSFHLLPNVTKNPQ